MKFLCVHGDYRVCADDCFRGTRRPRNSRSHTETLHIFYLKWRNLATMVDLFRCVGRSQLAFGTISLMSGIFAFFPVVSYKPWYVGWSTKIAAPVWTGLLVVIAGTCLLVANREQKKKSMWELCYMFSILCTVTCPMHFAVAVASIMIGPRCYYSFFGAVGTEYLGHAVEFPFPYLRFPGLCLDPLHYEWYHVGLQAADLLCSTAVFILSLTIVIMLTLRLLRSGHVNKT